MMRLVRTFAGLAALALATLPAHATTFIAGQFVTFDQSVWGSAPDGFNAATLLENNFDTIFAPAGGFMEVGVPGAAGSSLTFADADSVIAYLPASGAPGPLTVDLLDPVSSISGVFGGEVVALTLNVLFSDAGLIAHPAGVPLGDLVFQDLDSLIGQPTGLGGGLFGPEIANLDGFTVRDVLLEANLRLGGEKSFANQFSPDELDAVLAFADTAFNEGLLNPGAQYLAPPLLDGGGGAPAAPELPTWAMGLIGFAGLGLAAWRASRRGGVAASRCVRQEPLTA
jgi:hypothetical protein